MSTANKRLQSELLANIFQTEQAEDRIESLRRALDKGLDALVDKEPTDCTGIVAQWFACARGGTSLRLPRGMVTALRHQTDADRTAFLLKEALTDLSEPRRFKHCGYWNKKTSKVQNGHRSYLMIWR